MKHRWTLTIGVALAILMIASGLIITNAHAQAPILQTPGSPMQRTIQVSGSGIAIVTPDIAYIMAGVSTQAATAGSAMQQNNQTMNNVMNAIRQAGVSQENIQTQTISLSPQYENQNQTSGQPKITGYTATNIVQVNVVDISQVGQVLDAAVQAGANQIGSIRFDISDPEQAQQQARQEGSHDRV